MSTGIPRCLVSKIAGRDRRRLLCLRATRIWISHACMKWEQLSEFVETWAASQGLPANMGGRSLTLVDFANEADCVFFYPDRDLVSQKAFTMALSKFARARNARTEHVTIHPEQYRAWLAAEKLDDGGENRERFIESRYRLLPA